MLRLFISAHLPPDLLAAITDLQARLKRQLDGLPLAWTRPEGIHLTLKFLGETNPARVDDIVAGLRAAVSSHPPLTVTVAGLGCFPNLRQPNVIWVGVEDPDQTLRRLAASVDAATARQGWEQETRAFSGHLTLARVKRGAGNEERRTIGEQVGRLPLPDPLGLLPIPSLHLMRSELKPGGAVYTQLAVARLGISPGSADAAA
jgi:2'-5' RNA ligase